MGFLAGDRVERLKQADASALTALVAVRNVASVDSVELVAPSLRSLTEYASLSRAVVSLYLLTWHGTSSGAYKACVGIDEPCSDTGATVADRPLLPCSLR